MGFGVGGGLGLVADDVVPVGGAGIEGVLEELADEGGRQADGEDLVVLGGLLGELLDGGGADGEVVTSDVVGLGVLDKLPDVGAGQVLKVVVVGGTELGAHGAVVAGDDNTATAGGDLGVDAVLDAETGGLDGILEDGGVLVVADTAEVDDGVGREDVLGTASGVLGSAAGNQLGVVVVEEVLVDAKVLLLSEDGIVLLEAILFEESLVTNCLDVWVAVLIVDILVSSSVLREGLKRRWWGCATVFPGALSS